MTIRARLAFGLFAIALVLIVPLVLALKSSRDLHESTQQLRNQDFAALAALTRVRTELGEVRRAETNVGLTVVARDTLTSPLDTLFARLAAVQPSLDTLRRLDLTADRAQRIRETLTQVARLAAVEYRLARADSGEKALELSRDSVIPAITETESIVRGAERDVASRLTERVGEARAASEEAQQASLAAFAVALALALVIAIAIWRSIARPIRNFEIGMAEVAGGNFRYELPVAPTRRDEFGRLSMSFRSMAAQLGQLDRLKAEFISVASHELKTPVNVILGYIQLLEEGVYGTVTHKQREILRTLEAQTLSLGRLVHQLLDISRFEAGGGKLDLRTVDLPGFLRDLEQTFRVLSIQRGIDFQLHRGDPLPGEVQWDPDRMNEVLGNLLSNAFKFTNRGGTVELRADRLDGDVQIAVSDTGAGIPPEQLPHIFEKFFQANNQDSAAHGGTGLGLAIARQIVVAHGGSITVDSTLGTGTTFTISLPVLMTAPNAAHWRSLSVGTPV
ncbi:MAG: HAMP domain-containing histidine kinase [Gemmatimonadota bacterium]|nr:HAMP domain-containing histidine kinase [Gemmatimonadota bacterium]